MNPDTPRDLYVKRDVDDQLWKLVSDGLLSGQPARWISLLSAPGRGNTRLLMELRDRVPRPPGLLHDFLHDLPRRWKNALHRVGLRKSRATRRRAGSSRDTPVLLVRPDSRGAGGPGSPSPRPAPGTLHPLAEEFVRAHTGDQVSTARFLLRRFGREGRRNLLLAGLAFLVVLLAGFFLQSVKDFNTARAQRPAEGATTLWAAFGRFLRGNWALPLAAVGVTLLSPLVVPALKYVYRRWLLRQPAPEKPGQEEYPEYQDARTLADELARWCEGKNGLLILVDDAYALSDPDKRFLIEVMTRLAAPPSPARHHVVLVTLDLEGRDWEPSLPKVLQKLFATLPVPGLTEIDLRNIARTRLGQTGGPGGEEEVEALVKKAGGDPNALFPDRAESLTLALSQEFGRLHDEGIAKEFNLEKVIVYQLVRQAGQGAGSVTKTDLLNWVQSLRGSDHLRAFGMDAPRRAEKLVRSFVKSKLGLVEVPGEACRFNIPRCRALLTWLEGAMPALVAQAHYYWLWHWLGQVPGGAPDPERVAPLSAPERRLIELSAWHAAQLGLVPEKGASLVDQLHGLSAKERLECRRRVARVLLTAAVIRRGEGATEESDQLILDAVEWAGAEADSHRPGLFESAAGQLWRNYWRSGNPKTRERLRRLANDSPDLTDKPTWRVNARLEEVLQPAKQLSQVPTPPTPDPALLNLHLLAETLCAVRTRYGFLSEALTDPGLDIPEPRPADEDPAPELLLLQLRAAAFARRQEEESLSHALAQWGRRIAPTVPGPGRLGDEALHAFQVGRYWHELAEAWPANRDPTGGRPRRLVDHCLTPLDEGARLPEAFRQNAQAAYERSRQIAALLDWRFLLMEVSFHLGGLLCAQPVTEPPSEARPGWYEWDELFEQCLLLEGQAGWVVKAPAVHRARWSFFEQRDRVHSVEDAYNLYRAVERAGYPARVVLEWHKRVSALLNNYYDTEEDNRRSAELQLEWARRLAALREAGPFRHFKKTLEHEQAYSLLFAAQAMRNAGELSRAEELLDEADSLVARVPADPAADPEEAKKLRDLAISLGMQRAWLWADQPGRREQYRGEIRRLWRDVRPDDSECANLLGSLLNVEDEEERLAEPWPPRGASTPFADPDNESMSLPAEWFAEAPAPDLRNRFGFRFRQLAWLGSRSRRPSVEEFAWLVPLKGMVAPLEGISRFGETALRFAYIGLAQERSAETDEIMHRLLVGVRSSFAKWYHVYREELRALALLVRYRFEEARHRSEYVKLLCERQRLWWRELQLAELAKRRNWSAVAARVNDYLGLLQDESLVAHRAGLLHGRHGSEERLVQAVRVRKNRLKEAREAFRKNDLTACLRTLQPGLPPEGAPWIFLEDVAMLDLWLRCAPSSPDIPAPEISRRASQIRTFALGFVRQFSEVIREDQVKDLASRLVEALADVRT